MLPDETPISGGTWFYKWVYPILIGIFTIVWCGFVVHSINQGVGEGAAFLSVVGAIAFFAWTTALTIREAILLKEVYLGVSWIRVSNLRTEIVIPLKAIETVTQTRLGNVPNRATVTLINSTEFGDHFTFMPRGAKRTPHFTKVVEDHVVTDLRERIEAARSGPRKLAPATNPLARSIMADAELDGPF